MELFVLALHLLAVAVSLLFLVGLVRALSHKKERRGATAVAKRHHANPLLVPSTFAWETAGVFNPAAVNFDGLTHLFYRALGSDGVSRIGYAHGNHSQGYERNPYPVFALDSSPRFRGHRLLNHPGLVASGGSWSGTEDPRAVILDDTLYLSFSAFSGWDSIRMGVVSLPLEDVAKRRWRWSRPVFLSPPREVHKNWVLFPERINGKIAVLHSINGPDPDKAEVAYLDTLDTEPDGYIKSPFVKHARDSWDHAVRGVGSPPLRTKDGWLVFYHATSKDEGHRYKVGALLLDAEDPSKIIARSREPVLAPDAWYENEGAKAGVVYVCGSVLEGDDIHLYYGGADSHVCSAHLSLAALERQLVS